jgi:hypothetical protein
LINCSDSNFSPEVLNKEQEHLQKNLCSWPFLPDIRKGLLEEILPFDYLVQIVVETVED